MTEEMPPGRGTGAGGPGDALPALIRSWQHQREAGHRAAESANIMMMKNRMVPPPYYRELLSLASALIAEGRYEFRYELAVIVAQMACEVVVEQKLTPLLKGSQPPRTFSLHKGALGRYTQLTHDRTITKKPFWKPFIRHAKRRNKIVHGSARANGAEGRESLTVATQLVDHVEKVRGEALR